MSGPRIRCAKFFVWAAFGPLTIGAAEPPRYNRDIRPILADKCLACHGPDAAKREADLRLDDRESATKVRDGTAAIVPGDPKAGELMRRITSADPDLRMPPASTGKSLSPEEAARLADWIADGAEYEPHWAYLPPRRPAGLDSIDAILAARFRREGLAPAAPADPATLVRRLSFDLVGLPPSPEDVARFVADPSATAWEALVDRYLSSPHYGERMASFWFDLVRFADTVGYHGDQEHAAQPYRDYVIRAFWKNKPFDEFTREQLAGDLLTGAGNEQKIASCYNRLLQTSHEGGVQVKEYLTKYESDRVRNLGGAWLGATLGCCECHDHKYDPFRQRDFYRFAAIFADIDDLRSFKGVDATPTKRDPEIVVLSPFDQDRLDALREELQEFDGRIAATEFADAELELERRRRQREIAVLAAQTLRCMVTEAIEPRPIRVRARGDWLDESGSIVESGVPDWLSPAEISGRRFTRLDLAQWLTSPDNPLTARVFANRMWALFFGSGISRSLEDFGAQGEAPNCPELLDFLACDFAEHWDVKRLVKSIVLSDAYRRSSRPTPALADRDPENRWFARQNAFRLPAEMIRDNALELSGLLNKRVGGPKAHPYQPAGYYQFLNFPKRDYVADADENQYRRGVYVHWQRQYLHPMLRAFDAPMREECTAKRPTSNTPIAALTLLNDPTFLEAARALALRAMELSGSTEERLRGLWRRTLSREPDAAEIAEIERVLSASRAEFAANSPACAEYLHIGLSPIPQEIDPVELAAWTTACRVMLNLHETITRE